MLEGNIINRIIAYEEGAMNEEDIVTFFQDMIDSGVVWQLQGSYHRAANALIKAGKCHRSGVGE